MMEAHDRLIKILSTVFLNPADESNTGKKIFIQQFLGCGCPDAVVEQARVRFLSKALGVYIDTQIAKTPPSKAVTPLEKAGNSLLQIPKTLKWPRSSKAKIVSPSSWRSTALDRVTKNVRYKKQLGYFRALCNTAVDGVIEVPQRAFFFIVVQGKRKLIKNTLRMQYESGQMLYQLMGYNRCRLFTITEEEGPKRIDQIDTALTWSDLAHAFDAARERYSFTEIVLSFLKTIDTGELIWKNNTNFPSVTC